VKLIKEATRDVKMDANCGAKIKEKTNMNMEAILGVIYISK